MVLQTPTEELHQRANRTRSTKASAWISSESGAQDLCMVLSIAAPVEELMWSFFRDQRDDLHLAEDWTKVPMVCNASPDFSAAGACLDKYCKMLHARRGDSLNTSATNLLLSRCLSSHSLCSSHQNMLPAFFCFHISRLHAKVRRPALHRQRPRLRTGLSLLPRKSFIGYVFLMRNSLLVLRLCSIRGSHLLKNNQLP